MNQLYYGTVSPWNENRFYEGAEFRHDPDPRFLIGTDPFEEGFGHDKRAKVFGLIDSMPRWSFLLRTRNPQNVREHWTLVETEACPNCYGTGTADKKDCPQCGGEGESLREPFRKNVWLYLSASTQAELDAIPQFLNHRDLVPVYGLHITPKEELDTSELLGNYSCVTCGYRGFDAIKTSYTLKDECPDCGTIEGDGFGFAENDIRSLVQFNHVTISGGDEPMHPSWVRSIVKQCEKTDVPVWFTGWGEYCPYEENGPYYVSQNNDWIEKNTLLRKRFDAINWRMELNPNEQIYFRWGSEKSGNTLDGRTIQQLPEVSRV